MTDPRNLPQIADDAALAALDEATWDRRYFDGSPVPRLGVPWNAGLRATVPQTHVVLRLRGDEIVYTRFYDDEACAKVMATYGAGDGTPYEGCRCIVAKIVKDVTP